MYDQFLELKHHAEEMNQTPTRWVVGPNVVETVQKYMGMPGRASDTDLIEFFGVPMKRSVDLPDGCVTLKCGEWSAGAFNLKELDHGANT